jgi:hypothetical protein
VRRSPWLASCLVVALAAPALAATLPPQQQALVILRTLAYDRNLKARAGAKVTVALLTGDVPCAAVKSALEESGRELSVSGLPVRVISVAWGDGAAATLAAEKPVAVYVCPGLDAAVATITGYTRQNRVLSFSGSPEDVDNGVAIGVIGRGDKAAVLVNLAAARAEGAQLDSALLRVAEVIGR